MDIHASLRHLHMSPRKVRLVVDVIRGRSIADAIARLQFLKKGAAEPVLKLLNSAIANAEHNFHLAKETLFVKTITADAGVTIKRSRPRAFGRAAPIRKRSTHIKIVLSDEKKETSKVKAQTSNKTQMSKRKSQIAKPDEVVPIDV